MHVQRNKILYSRRKWNREDPIFTSVIKRDACSTTIKPSLNPNRARRVAFVDIVCMDVRRTTSTTTPAKSLRFSCRIHIHDSIRFHHVHMFNTKNRTMNKECERFASTKPRQSECPLMVFFFSHLIYRLSVRFSLCLFALRVGFMGKIVWRQAGSTSKTSGISIARQRDKHRGGHREIYSAYRGSLNTSNNMKNSGKRAVKSIFTTSFTYLWAPCHWCWLIQFLLLVNLCDERSE